MGRKHGVNGSGCDRNWLYRLSTCIRLRWKRGMKETGERKSWWDCILSFWQEEGAENGTERYFFHLGPTQQLLLYQKWGERVKEREGPIIKREEKVILCIWLTFQASYHPLHILSATRTKQTIRLWTLTPFIVFFICIYQYLSNCCWTNPGTL